MSWWITPEEFSNTCKKKMNLPKSKLAMQIYTYIRQYLMVITFLEYIYRITLCEFSAGR